jgi:hypothetical protein
MKTNVLMLDTLKGMKNLIFSAFMLSDWQRRKLKVVYVEDFNWVSSANYLGVTPASLGAGMELAEAQNRSEYEQAGSEIRRIIYDYLSFHKQHIPYSYEVLEYNRLAYIEELLVDNPDMLLLMSNYNSVSDIPGGIINYPNILDKVNCPVLVVPDDRPYLSFNKLLYATALHREDIGALRNMVELFASDSYPRLHVFHHSKSGSFERELRWLGFQALVKDAVPQLKPEFYLSKEGQVDAALEAYIENYDFDLIAALKERKGFFEAVFGSSHTHELIRHFNKPVLVYHENREE